MSTIEQKIADIESEMAMMQKNKATNAHRGRLRAKLATLRREQLAETMNSKGGGAGRGFDVQKAGVARVGLVGFPSTGKSTLLNAMTDTVSEVAAYEFCTLTAVPGKCIIHETPVQLLDLPGIIEGAAGGRGRGRQVIGTAKTCDLIIVLLDATKPVTTKHQVVYECEGAGIRLNRNPRDIRITKTDTGGVTVKMLQDCPGLYEEAVSAALKEYKLCNCSILIRDANVTLDDVIDAAEDFLGSPRTYIPALYVMNKCDSLAVEEFKALSKLPNFLFISAAQNWGLEELKEHIWEKLDLIRVYTKPPGKEPDLTEPVVARRGSTVATFCNKIHRTFLEKFNHALVWGRSSKHFPQRVGKDHVLEDGDVVQLVLD